MSILNDFSIVESGSGVVAGFGTSGIRCTATTTNGASFFREFPAIAGVKYTCTFTARVTLVSGATPIFVSIDSPASGTIADRQILSETWETYVLAIQCPIDSDPLVDIVSFSFGVFIGTEGEVEFNDIRFATNNDTIGYSQKTVEMPLYTGAGVLIPNATFSANLYRVGDLVTFTASTTFGSLVSESDIYTGDEFLPTWATPERKSTQFCEFSTSDNYFTATDVLSSLPKAQRVAMYKREISGGISALDFGTVNQVFSISYIAKSVAT